MSEKCERLVTSLEGCKILGVRAHKNPNGGGTYPTHLRHVFKGAFVGKLPCSGKKPVGSLPNLYDADKLVELYNAPPVFFTYCLGATSPSGYIPWINIGCSRVDGKTRPKKRFQTHQCSSPLSLQILFIIKYNNRENCLKKERELHSSLAPYLAKPKLASCLPKELFRLTHGAREIIFPYWNNPEYHPDKFLS